MPPKYEGLGHSLSSVICEACRAQIDPDVPDTVRAVEMQKTVAMGPTVDYVEGLGVFFHEDCYPTGSALYRRKQ